MTNAAKGYTILQLTKQGKMQIVEEYFDTEEDAIEWLKPTGLTGVSYYIVPIIVLSVYN